jgi:glutaredoxin 3
MKIKMYTSNYCPYCMNAERLLKNKGYDIHEKVFVDQDPMILEKMIELTGKRTVPQIFIEDHYIGGFDDLRKVDASGELDKILSTK